MTTTRKPKYLTHAEAELLIAEAVAAERARSEQALAGVMLALGGAGQALEDMADGLTEAHRLLDVHAGVIRPMAEVLAAGLDMSEVAETVDSGAAAS